MMEIYGETVTCNECESDNMVERQRESMTPGGPPSTYSVAVCRTCGHEQGV